MAKRFTDSDKWRVVWFRRLPAGFKLAWLYLLDNCDQAGVIRIDEELADFQIGQPIAWNDFLNACEDRIARIDGGKIWIREFIAYQYGELSDDCRPHRPVLDSLRRHGLEKDYERVLKGYSKGINTLKDKDKDKDKDQDKDKEGDGWLIPVHLDCDEVRRALNDFAAMRRKIRKPIKDLANSSRILKQFSSKEQLLRAIDKCIGNEWQGLDPQYGEIDDKASGKPANAPKYKNLLETGGAAK